MEKVCWYNVYLDKCYVDNWKMWFSMIIVFNGLGNISLAVMRYRRDENFSFGSLRENVKWILMLAIFGGASRCVPRRPSSGTCSRSA